MNGQTQSLIQIRRAVSDDAGTIAAVLSHAFEEYKAAYTLQAFQATTPTAEQIEKRMKEGPIWIAVEKSIVVGTVSAVPEGTSLYIRSMAVLPAVRGRGIGRVLLGIVEDYAVQNGCKRMRLSTTPFLTQAIHLYERFGFSKSNEGPQALYETPLFTMVKTIR